MNISEKRKKIFVNCKTSFIFIYLFYNENKLMDLLPTFIKAIKLRKYLNWFLFWSHRIK